MVEPFPHKLFLIVVYGGVLAVGLVAFCRAGEPKPIAPFTAQISQVWIPDGQLNVIHCIKSYTTLIRQNIDLVMILRVANTSSQPIEIADYALEVKSPNGNWTPTTKPLLRPYDGLWTEYLDKTHPPIKYLDFTKNSFEIQARSKAIKPGDSIEGWALFNVGYKPDHADTKLRLTLWKLGGEVIQRIELVNGPGIRWVSLFVGVNPYPSCK